MYKNISIHENEIKKNENEIQQLVDMVKKDTGVCSSHLIPLHELAKEMNCIISIRPVDKFATEYIENGYPTKNFNIKGKSASWGPQAGLICADQKFSKLEHKDASVIDKYNIEIERSIKKNNAIKIPLSVSKQRLETLVRLGAIKDFPLNGGELKAEGTSGKTYIFELQRKSYGFDSEADFNVLYNGNNIEVLSYPGKNKPITADYDLFMICPSMEEFGPLDNLPNKDISHEVFKKRTERYKITAKNSELHRLKNDKEYFLSKENPALGNASARISNMIEIFNKKLVGEGEKVIHHSTDSANPFTQVEDNYPITLALPKKIGDYSELCIIKNSEDLASFIKEAKEYGYYVQTNPGWEKEVASVKRPNFELIINKFTKNL
ncbi:anthrax toxin-like adenylyl cyclase domain-containing protein [Candidatus Arsenophonus triatominarum]|uniref:anthrax toxin-like adenylyl cyclase domain-containing protein n=1 Tax=Candidatus Arsenophonus triatominarum TaxID=57911 RepID=UPI00164F9F76|nr:anthrax toxin-like adenylyl cyclase domain-containing protein [Candidatus Arsenophonus triatominarum]